MELSRCLLSRSNTPCRIRSDRQTTSLTLTTGVCEAGTKMRGASNMNIHYDVTGLLTAAWRSHSGQIVWAAWINCELAREEEGGGGFWTHSTYTGYPGSAGGRQLDRWRWSNISQTPAWIMAANYGNFPVFFQLSIYQSTHTLIAGQGPPSRIAYSMNWLGGKANIVLCTEDDLVGISANQSAVKWVNIT